MYGSIVLGPCENGGLSSCNFNANNMMIYPQICGTYGTPGSNTPIFLHDADAAAAAAADDDDDDE